MVSIGFPTAQITGCRATGSAAAHYWLQTTEGGPHAVPRLVAAGPIDTWCALDGEQEEASRVKIWVQHIVGHVVQLLCNFTQETQQDADFAAVRRNNSARCLHFSALPWTEMHYLAQAIQRSGDARKYHEIVNGAKRLPLLLLSSSHSMPDVDSISLPYVLLVWLCQAVKMDASQPLLYGPTTQNEAVENEHTMAYWQVLDYIVHDLQADLRSPALAPEHGASIFEMAVTHNIRPLVGLMLDAGVPLHNVTLLRQTVWHLAVHTAVNNDMLSNSASILTLLLTHKNGPLAQGISLRSRNAEGQSVFHCLEEQLNKHLAESTRQVERLKRQTQKDTTRSSSTSATAVWHEREVTMEDAERLLARVEREEEEEEEHKQPEIKEEESDDRRYPQRHRMLPMGVRVSEEEEHRVQRRQEQSQLLQIVGKVGRVLQLLQTAQETVGKELENKVQKRLDQALKFPSVLLQLVAEYLV